jgi:hypothetical protein
MELFFPSVIILLLAAAAVFFVLPQFGPATLAIVSAGLLALGLYQHYSTFSTEYRFSTWHLVAFSPYFLIGGLLVVIAVFLLYTLPVSGPANVLPNVQLPTVANMPPANTSTNVFTSAINNSLNTAASIVGNNGKNNGLSSLLPNLNGKKKQGINFPFSQV